MILKILEKGSTKVYAPDDQVADYLFLGFTDTGTTTEVVVTDPSKEIVEMKIEDDIVTAFRYKGDSVWRTVAGGSGTDTYKVKVDGTDTADYLENKLQQGTNVTITKSGGKLVVNSTGGSGEAGVTVYSDLATIKAIDTTSITTVQTVQVTSLGLYKFKPASTLTGDDVNVITPTTGSGRWIKQSIDMAEIVDTAGMSWSKTHNVITIKENDEVLISKKTRLDKKRKVVFLGSSLCSGAGATAYANSYAGLLTTYLQTLTEISYVNIENLGIGGNSSATVRDRFSKDVVSRNPDVVIIGVCSNNDGLYSTGTSTILDTYIYNVQKIVSMCIQYGYEYVVMGEYGVNTPVALGWYAKKVLNFKMQKIFKHRYVNVLGSVTVDSTGAYKTGIFLDSLHLNDLGHSIFYNCIDRKIFDDIGLERSVFYPTKQGSKITEAVTNAFTLFPKGYALTSDYINEYTCFVDVKLKTGATVSKTLIKIKSLNAGTAYTPTVYINSSGYIELREGDTVKYTSTIKLSENYKTQIGLRTSQADNSIQLIVNGNILGSYTPTQALGYNLYRLNLGCDVVTSANTAINYEFSNFVLYAGCLDLYTIKKISNKDFSQSNILFANSLSCVNSTDAVITSETANGLSATTSTNVTFENEYLNDNIFTDAEKSKLATINAVGATVASATTIVAPSTVFHVSGTVAISTITIPYTGFTGMITIIPDGIFTLATGGNIAEAYTVVVGRAIQLVFDGTAWYRA